jgi:hypothetical protein
VIPGHHAPFRTFDADAAARDRNQPAITALEAAAANRDCDHPSVTTLRADATAVD